MQFTLDNGALSLGYAFAAGVISSLTPCVYPMIPITLSIFGAHADAPRGRAFKLSLIYVAGLALTYTVLGMLCAKTGMVFGSLLGNPYIVAGLCLFLILLSLSALDILNLRLSALQAKASGVQGTGPMGIFFMGTVSGLLAAPCIGPVLIVILLEAAKTGNAVWGAMLLFSYSLGMGMLFVLIGTFSSRIKFLPKSGGWLLAVKFLIAVGVLMAAVSLLNSLDLKVLQEIAALNVIAVGIVALVSIGAARMSYKRNFKPGQFGSALALSLALSALFVLPKPVAVSSVRSHSIQWLRGSATALQTAQAQAKPIMMDLYADWCANCKKLEHQTFSEPGVAEEVSNRLVAAKVDFTTDTDETDQLAEKYNVQGLPCVLFLNPDGSEIPESRVTGFMESKDFLSHLERVNAGFMKENQNAKL